MFYVPMCHHESSPKRNRTKSWHILKVSRSLSRSEYHTTSPCWSDIDELLHQKLNSAYCNELEFSVWSLWCQSVPFVVSSGQTTFFLLVGVGEKPQHKRKKVVWPHETIPFVSALNLPQLISWADVLLLATLPFGMIKCYIAIVKLQKSQLL